MEVSDQVISELILTAFERAYENESIKSSNSKKSSFFVSQLADLFAEQSGKKALVQHTDQEGNKFPGEWLLDIAIVSEEQVGTSYKNRKANIIKKIHWAIESEFSTQLNEFVRDFAKLLHIKSDAYLYIAGLNQQNESAREQYIEAQIKLAEELVLAHEIDQQFYLAFVPTPGKCCEHRSLWDADYEELKTWIKVVNLSGIAVCA